jgi:endonuclease/exonuclease/phosphatase family metal-dependent hydrolase
MRQAGFRRLRGALILTAALAGGLAVGAGAAACGGTATAPTSAPSPQASPMTLKVMEFNIEYGGTQIDFAKVVEAVKAAGPDVVGLEEAETNTGRLARALGWKYSSNGMQLLSKYPIIEASGAEGLYVLVQVRPGACVAVSNVHLPSENYGPHLIRLGMPVEKVVANEEKVRLPSIQRQLDVLPPLADRGIPVFLMGDFNAPSHLDYTAAVVGTRDYVRYVVDWPVSKAVEAAGFRDSWREVNPDPLQSLGLTWWAGRPKVDGWNPGPGSPQDRIDFIYAAGPARAVAAQLAGEKGGPEVSFPVKPWPSDHRAVVATFAVTPGTLPTLVATNERLLRVGRPLVVTYHTPGWNGVKVELRPDGGDGLTFGGSDVSAPPLAAQAAPSVDGTLTFTTDGMAPGAYVAMLVGENRAPLAYTRFWLKAKGALPRLSTDKRSYAVGEPIDVVWADAPANRWDWIGVYEAAAADPLVDSYLIWQYTGGAASGTMAGPPAGTLALDGAAWGKPWPLPPGRYKVFYLLADGYKAVASANFTVTM